MGKIEMIGVLETETSCAQWTTAGQSQRMLLWNGVDVLMGLCDCCVVFEICFRLRCCR